VPPRSPYQVEIANRQRHLRVDRGQVARAIRLVLQGEGVASAAVSVAVVNDATIHRLNREFLGHDYPTDVLSFELDRGDGCLEGELVLSAETAVRSAADYGWLPHQELLLYVIHGALHLTGYDDGNRAARKRMNRRQDDYLSQLGAKGRRNAAPQS
jgi:probable rRNA maturation factor